MRSSAALAALLATLALAADDMNIPTLNITAGETFLVTNLTQVPDPKLTATRVFLQSSVTYYSYCMLIPSLPINTTTFNVTIPASAGPAGYYYRIATANYYNLATHDVGLPVPFYSPQFFLSNPSTPSHSKAWLDWEIHHGAPAVVGVDIPCSSYDCVRKCVETGPLPVNDEGGGGWTNFGGITYDIAYLDCVNACPDVAFDPQKLDNRPGYVSVTTGGAGAATTTGASTWYGTGVTVEPSSSLSWPTYWSPRATSTSAASGTCPTEGANRFHTPCGSECCDHDQLCWLWNVCRAAGGEDEVASTTSAAVGGFPGNTGLPTATATTMDGGSRTTASDSGETAASASASSAQPSGNGAVGRGGSGLVACVAGAVACMMIMYNM